MAATSNSGSRDAQDIRILVVDDDAAVRTTLRRILARMKYPSVSIREAGSGEEGLEVLSEATFDLVVSDQRMGKVTGVDVLERVRRSHPGTARVLVTGYGDLELAVDAVNRAHIEGFIRKPWDNTAMKTLVEALLDERTAREAA